MSAACRGRPICSRWAAGSPIRRRYEQRLRSAVAEIVNKQVELGIDVVDDGEYSKPSFVTYINERLGGFETDKTGGITNQWSRSREALAFPEYYNSPANAGPPRPPNMVCTGADHTTRATTSSNATSRTSRPRSAA